MSLYGCVNTVPQDGESTSQISGPSSNETRIDATSGTAASAGATSSTGSPNTVSQIIINEIDDKKGTFYLGQSYIDVSSILNDCEVEVLQGNDSTLVTECFHITFYDSKVNGIFVEKPSEMPTSYGLNFGNSVVIMEKLYGTDYTRVDYSSDTFECIYIFDGHVFHVGYKDDKMFEWGITGGETKEYMGK
jgi:hypothetical protein